MSEPLLIPVVLCGGAGTRLWPASRASLPKPYLRLHDGSTLLERTLTRAEVVALPHAPLYTVTAAGQAHLVRKAYNALGLAERARLLLEPQGRNTAPAIALAAHAIRREYGDETLMLVLAADHLIEDVAGFAAAVANAKALAAAGELVTFAVKPTRAETGYGYLKLGAPLGDHGWRLDAFVEKPDRVRAEQFVAAGGYGWNSGMFCFAAGRFLATLEKVAPQLAAQIDLLAAAATGSETTLSYSAADFALLPSISVDYAVMEKAPQVAAVDAAFDWSDIGSWDALAALTPADGDGNRQVGAALQVASRNTFVHSHGRLVTTVGVSDLLIVDTDDAVLVTHRERAQDVKQLVDELNARADPRAHTHLTVHRPWGHYTVLEDRDDCKVKRLVVDPGQVLSLQMHHRRSEHWTVVAGTATVTIGDETFDLECGRHCHIPVQTKHRLANQGTDPLAVIEVQVGDYFGEDDIVRFEDRYGRV